MENNKKRKLNESQSPEMKYFLNESKSDVIFIVEEQRIPAIRLLLSVKSDVFEAMFSGEFKESKDKEIVVKELKAEAFIQMIRFIYCDELDDKYSDNHLMAIEIYRCGHKYQLKPLMNTIESQLMPLISMNTIEDIYSFANIYKTEKLIKALNEFVDKNIKLFLAKDMNEMKRLNTTSDNYIMEAIINAKNEEIKEKEKIYKMSTKCENLESFLSLSSYVGKCVIIGRIKYIIKCNNPSILVVERLPIN